MRKLLRFLKTTVVQEREEGDEWHVGTILFPLLAIIFFCLGGRMMFHGLSSLLIFIGLSLNRVVVSVNNGKMPVYVRSFEERVKIIQNQKEGDTRHTIMDENSHLRWLGDIFYFKYLLGGAHASIGDILQFLGLGLSASILLGWF